MSQLSLNSPLLAESGLEEESEKALKLTLKIRNLPTCPHMVWPLSSDQQVCQKRLWRSRSCWDGWQELPRAGLRPLLEVALHSQKSQFPF